MAYCYPVVIWEVGRGKFIAKENIAQECEKSLFRTEWICFYTSVNCCERSETLSKNRPTSRFFVPITSPAIERGFFVFGPMPASLLCADDSDMEAAPI